MKKRIIALFLSAMITLTFVACTDPFAKDLPITSKENLSSADNMDITGRIVVGKHSYLIVTDDTDEPISLSVIGSEENFFKGYNTGDRVSVVSSWVAETYPAQATVSHIKLLEKGNESDISVSVMSQLRELGWIE